MLLIFIGYLLAFLHITINGSDLLPNFLGYFFIYLGLSSLAAHSPRLAQARPWAMGLAVFHFLFLATTSFGMTLYGILLFVVNILSICAALYLSYLTVGGIGQLEQAADTTLGAERLFTLWKVHAAFQLALPLLSPLADTGLHFLPAILIFATIAINIVFLVFLYKAKTLYAQSGHPSH